MPNNYCQTFKQKIEELKGKAQSIEGLLLEYRNTGNEKIAEELVEEIDKILQEIEEFKKEYEEKVKELLIEWYPKKDKINEFLQNLKINERGRVEIEELDLSFCNLSGTLYLLSLFEKIEVLNCFYNKLISLPELPDGLKRLDCSYNQLTSLPELPNGLEELNCSDNKLTSLPELPNGLKRLSCYNNKLTSLPELPAGLQWLNCFHNPLSPKTIKKIKSHPNYNIHTWLI
jgi:Leucine-rich repeat (LRR) protein